MILQLVLNKKQEALLREMLETGLHGKSIEAVAIRILDEAFIQHVFTKAACGDDEEKEPWQKDDL